MKNELKELKICDVEKVSFRVCLIKQYEEMLKNEEQTEQLCLEAVRCDGLLLKYVKNQTLGMCVDAIKQNRKAVLYVNDNVWLEFFNMTPAQSDAFLDEVFSTIEQ